MNRLIPIAFLAALTLGGLPSLATGKVTEASQRAARLRDLAQQLEASGNREHEAAVQYAHLAEGETQAAAQDEAKIKALIAQGDPPTDPNVTLAKQDEAVHTIRAQQDNMQSVNFAKRSAADLAQAKVDSDAANHIPGG